MWKQDWKIQKSVPWKMKQVKNENCRNDVHRKMEQSLSMIQLKEVETFRRSSTEPSKIHEKQNVPGSGSVWSLLLCSKIKRSAVHRDLHFIFIKQILYRLCINIGVILLLINLRWRHYEAFVKDPELTLNTAQYQLQIKMMLWLSCGLASQTELSLWLLLLCH